MRKILIINSNYYKTISKNLVLGAKKIFKKAKFKVFIIEVPGIHEIPVAIKKNIKKFDAFVALGCVIKGQTPHFDLISSSTFSAIIKLSVDFEKPIGNGIITSFNLKQAQERSKRLNNKKPNKGSEAAKAVLYILNNEPKKI
tara:strand:- start:995 stop:1420 length:426 start_codon:yes stop_codon:yes gene_type:complete